MELIKSILTKNCRRIGVTSFRLMKEYPNNVYLDVLEEYGKRFLFQAICQERSIVDADYFFKAVASYKQEKSAEILEPILKAIPRLTCPIDTGFLHQTLAYSIWNNRCAAYSDMTKKIKPLIVELEEFNKDKLNFETGDSKFRETIRW